MSLDEQIDQLCHKFEAAWTEGKRPAIRRVLERIPPQHKSPVLKQLIAVEIRCRIQAGQQPSPNDYIEYGDSAVEAASAAIEMVLPQTHPLGADQLNELMKSEFAHPGSSRDDSRSTSTVIGPYKILQKIASGGMGTVFMAEQTRPVRRRVALKLIKSDLDDQQIIVRFEAERQALALMDHANIARVLDAGTTSDGRPYFVMELVQGVPITEYCDRNKLSIEERLNLFIQTCRAIQHAHQKGIIHRDIKPSNILVAQQDGIATVKVIDFGLAKALQGSARLTEKTMFTEFGRVIGTLQYMSPEQAETDILDVDTRSDVYSLGVLLYELLTGSTPLEKQRLREMAQDRILVAIREQEAVRPSFRLSSLGQNATAVSERRSTDARRLTIALKGDLDWITMKSLEKTRSRRYQSAGAFADDVSKYLSGDAVTARPPSLLYLSSKLLRRHRVIASFATVIVSATFIALTASIWGLLKYREGERQEGEARQKVQESKQELEQQFYFANIEQAGQRLREGNVEDAKRLLALCPKHLRGWEHQYLSQISDESDLVIAAHSEGVRFADLSPSGAHVLTTGMDGGVSLWDAKNGDLVASSDERAEAKHSIPLNHQRCLKAYVDERNGRLILCLRDGEVKLIDAENFNEISQFKTSGDGDFRDSRVCLHGDGLVCLFGDELSVWDISPASQKAPQPVRRMQVLCDDMSQQTAAVIGVHPDGIHAAVFRQHLQLINLMTAEIAVTVNMPQPLISLDWEDRLYESPDIVFGNDGERIAVNIGSTVFHAATNYGVDIQTKETIAVQLFKIVALSYEASGNSIFAGLENGQLAIFENNFAEPEDDQPSILEHEKGKELKRLNGHSGRITSISTSADGEWLCSSSQDGTVRLWNVSGEAINQNLHFTSSGCGVGSELWIDEQSRTVLRWKRAGELELRDAFTLELKGTVAGPETFSLLQGTSLQVWQLPMTAAAFPPELQSLQEHLQNRHFLRFPKTGELTAIWAQSTPNEETATESASTAPVPVPEKFANLALSPDDQFLSAIQSDGICTCIRLSTGKVEFREVLGSLYGRLAYMDNGRSLLVQGHESVVLRLPEFHTVTRQKEAFNLAVSHDGTQIAFSTRNNSIAVLNLQTNQMNSIPGIRLGVTAAEFSSDGKTLFTAGRDGTMRLWDIASGREIGILHDSGRGIEFGKIAFSSQIGCIFAVDDCHDEVYRWGLISDKAPLNIFQQLGTARSQSIPQVDPETLLKSISELGDILTSGQFALETADPSLTSTDYRVIANSVLRLAQLNQLGRLPEAWKMSPTVNRILEKETSFKPNDDVGDLRKALALFAKFKLSPATSFSSILGRESESFVADSLISMLTEDAISFDTVLSELLETQDPILQARLLTLLAELPTPRPQLQENQLARQLNPLFSSKDNSVRAAAYRLISMNAPTILTEELRTSAVTLFGAAFNSIGQPLAYFERAPDRKLISSNPSNTQRSVTAADDAPMLAVSMTEVTEAQYAEFRTDYPRKSNLPVTSISVSEMAEFCNWLSIKEGLTPCYRLSEFTEDVHMRVNIDDNRIEYRTESRAHSIPVRLANATGYRLPTATELESAGTEMSEEAPVSGPPPASRPSPVASLRPDHNGLFNLFGNVAEVRLFDGSNVNSHAPASVPPPDPSNPGEVAPAPAADLKSQDGQQLDARLAQAQPTLTGRVTDSAMQQTSDSPLLNSTELTWMSTNKSDRPTAFGGAFWGNPETLVTSGGPKISVTEPRPDVGFRVVRDVLPMPPGTPEFRITESISGRYISSVSMPSFVRTSFGTRVYFDVYTPLYVYEEEVHTYTVMMQTPVTRTRTHQNGTGALVEETYTVMVPYTEERQGRRIQSRVVWEKQWHFCDLKYDVSIDSLSRVGDAVSGRDITTDLTWQVESHDEGTCTCLVNFSNPQAAAKEAAVRLRIPSDIYVPIECQQPGFLQSNLPPEIARFIEKIDSAPQSSNEPEAPAPPPQEEDVPAPPPPSDPETPVPPAEENPNELVPPVAPQVSVDGWSGCLSNDGKFLYVVRNTAEPTGGGDLYRIDLSSNEEVLVLKNVKDEVCSPDGKWIACCRGLGSETNLVLFSTVDSNSREFGHGYMPVWTADSKYFYFIDTHGTAIRRFAIDEEPLVGDPTIELIADEITDHFAQVSPDQSKLALLDKAQGTLVVIEISSGSIVASTSVGDPPLLMRSWHPANTHLAFTGFQDGVWVMNVSTGACRKILAGPFVNPRWSADGSMLSVDDRGERQVHVFDLAGISLP